ncbi:hypothetical protein MKX01_009415, partial [Papaver californicum]
MFAHLQKEYTQTLDLILEIVDQDGPVYTYKVTSFKFSCARTIIFNSSDNFIQRTKKPIQGNSGSSTLMYSDLAHMALSLTTIGTSTKTSSAFTKKLLTGVLGELDSFLKSTQDDQTKKITNVADENNENMGQT